MKRYEQFWNEKTFYIQKFCYGVSYQERIYTNSFDSCKCTIWYDIPRLFSNLRHCENQATTVIQRLFSTRRHWFWFFLTLKLLFPPILCMCLYISSWFALSYLPSPDLTFHGGESHKLIVSFLTNKGFFVAACLNWGINFKTFANDIHIYVAILQKRILLVIYKSFSRKKRKLFIQFSSRKFYNMGLGRKDSTL